MKQASTNVISLSMITILWWASIWYLIEETIIYISGNKKHLKAAICISIIMTITFYCYVYPEHDITF